MSLSIAALNDAIAQAERFVELAEIARQTLRTSEYKWQGNKETAACRRASMDLTRALAELRRGIYK